MNCIIWGAPMSAPHETPPSATSAGGGSQTVLWTAPSRVTRCPAWGTIPTVRQQHQMWDVSNPERPGAGGGPQAIVWTPPSGVTQYPAQGMMPHMRHHPVPPSTGRVSNVPPRTTRCLRGSPGGPMDCTIWGDPMSSPGHDVLRETPPSTTWHCSIKCGTGCPT